MEMIRPRLYGDTKQWEQLIDIARELGVGNTLEQIFSNTGSTQFNSKDGSLISGKSARIKTLEDLLVVAQVNLDKWEVQNHTVNSWEQNSVEKGITTLHQVKAILRRKGLEEPDNTWTEKWLSKLAENAILAKVPKKYTETNDRPLVVMLADLHIGAIIEGDRLIEDYNVKVCEEKLAEIASYCNSKSQKVHLAILGDLIESFTGKNKADTWKQIELHGAKAALTAFDVLYKFFNSVTNLEKVYMVGGNHDRITDDKKDDPNGQVAELLFGMFKRMTKIPMEYDSLILTPVIDNIKYLLTHGDYLIKKKNAAELVLDYGSQNLFNLLVSAHLHQRIIRQDKLKFRDITIPSIITGSQYEKRNNWNSQSGFVTATNNGIDLPIVTDIPV